MSNIPLNINNLEFEVYKLIMYIIIIILEFLFKIHHVFITNVASKNKSSLLSLKFITIIIIILIRSLYKNIH